MTSVTTSTLHQETVRLKREVTRDDRQGHSCEHCRHVTLDRFYEFINGISSKMDEPFFLLDTSGAELQGLAASGCNFWTMLCNKLTLIELQEQIKHECDIMVYDNKIHGPRWSDTHLKDILAPLSGDLKQKLWYLLKSPVEWYHRPRQNHTIKFPVTDEDFARVVIANSFENYTNDSSIKVEVGLIVPRRPFNAVMHPERGNSELEMEGHYTTFWALSVSDQPEDWTKTCVGSPINLNPGSSLSLDLYRHWLENCEITHGCGINDTPKSMPSLALDVSDGDNVKLFWIPSGMRERYIALSYCWGIDAQAVMLTRSNENNLLSGINSHLLDPTINDSIAVARGLGFRFLWIDALCIFQDDEEWKARELGIMGEIYQNATLTIVAAAAKNVKEGFFRRRASTMDRFGNISGHPRPVFMFQAKECSEHNDENPIVLSPHILADIEPWYKRGWTLQEMLFSRRRLQFRGIQTTWLCHCVAPPARACDGWLPGGGRRGVERIYDPDLSEIITTMGATRESIKTSEVLSKWYELAEEYSGRKLRYITDRLPALSGVARAYASLLDDRYICGLWKSDLVAGLAWASLPPLQTTSHIKLGPSWSWASYEGPVSWLSRLDSPRPNQDFEILNDAIELKSPSNPFGEVQSAQLIVRGLLRSITTPERDKYGIAEVDIEDSQARITFDYPKDPRVQPGSAFKLSLLVLVNIDEIGIVGIVLLEEGDNLYSRVGEFDLNIVWSSSGKFSRSQEEFRELVRSLWGGEQSIRQFVLK